MSTVYVYIYKYLGPAVQIEIGPIVCCSTAAVQVLMICYNYCLYYIVFSSRRRAFVSFMFYERSSSFGFLLYLYFIYVYRRGGSIRDDPRETAFCMIYT